jgi:hypothetical protein
LANEFSCANGAQINFGDLTPYLTYADNVESIMSMLITQKTIWEVNNEDVTVICDLLYRIIDKNKERRPHFFAVVAT